FLGPSDLGAPVRLTRAIRPARHVGEFGTTVELRRVRLRRRNHWRSRPTASRLQSRTRLHTIVQRSHAFEPPRGIPLSGRIGFMLCVCAALGAGPAEGAAPADADGFDAHVRPFLANHCLPCHAGEKPRGKLRLDVLASNLADDAARARWTDVVERVEAG